MNASNNNTGSLCPGLEWYVDAGETVFFITFYIVIPIYGVIGTAVHAVCLKAFLVQVKTEKGYCTQLYLTVGRISLSICMALHVISMYWLATSTSPGTVRIRSSYWFMVFAGRLAPTLATVSTTACQLLTMLVAGDRVYALWKPYQYGVSNAKKRNLMWAVILAFLAMMAGIPNAFRNDVQQREVGNSSAPYVLVLNDPFSYSLLGKMLTNSRSVVELGGLVALYVCNVAIVCLYRMRRLQSKKILNKSNDAKKKEAIGRTLTVLALSQSICVTLTATHKGLFVLFMSLYPSVLFCQGALHVPLMMGGACLLDLLDIVCAFAVNKQFRTVILRPLCGNAGTSSGKIGPTPVVPIRRS